MKYFQEARKSLQETSPGRPPVLGIVSHADLRLGTAVNKIIEAHIEAEMAYFAEFAILRLITRIRQLLTAMPVE